jgi:hypothetical protein
MIIGLYLFVKVLIGKILLNTAKSGFGGAPGAMILSERVINNFKLVGSLILHCVVDYMNEIFST